MEFDTLCLQRILNRLDHFRIEGWQYLRLHFGKRDLEATVHKLFDDFQADKTRSDNDGLLRF